MELPPPTGIVLTLTPEEFHDLLVFVETAQPTFNNTTRRTTNGVAITYDRWALREDLLNVAKEVGL